MSTRDGSAGVRIAGTGVYLPGDPVDNKRLADFFGRDVVRVSEMLGGVSRHLAIDLATGKLRPGESNAHMAHDASARALADALSARRRWGAGGSGPGVQVNEGANGATTVGTLRGPTRMNGPLPSPN